MPKNIPLDSDNAMDSEQAYQPQSEEAVVDTAQAVPAETDARPILLDEFTMMFAPRRGPGAVAVFGLFRRRERDSGRISDSIENYQARLEALGREQHR